MMPAVVTFLRRTLTILKRRWWIVLLILVFLFLEKTENPYSYCKQGLRVFAWLDKNCYTDTEVPGLYFIPKQNSECFPFGPFPDKPHLMEKAPDTKRILVLGDSVTHNPGFLFTPAGTTYYELLQKYLDQNAHDSWKWEVINGGVQSYNTCQEVAYYRSVLGKYQPDIVILQYLEWNDYHEPAVPEFNRTFVQCMEDSVPDLLNLKPSWHRALSLHSGVYAFFNRRTYNLFGRFDPIKYPRTFYVGSGALSMVEDNRTALFSLIEELSRQKTPLFILVFPYLTDPYKPDAWLHQKVFQLLPPHRMAFLADTLLAEGSLPGFRYLPHDEVHPGRRGHQLAARVLEEMFGEYLKQVRSPDNS